MALLRILLFPLLLPLSALYGWMMQQRNRQYDRGQRAVVDFIPKIIAVGNLSMGGTGKTPMIEWLIRLLKDDYKVATISRGYGRKTKGFRLVGEEDTARTVGDEPLQFFRKYGEQVKVSVCEERILAVPEIVGEFPETQLFLLDDAYQHRKIGRDLNILLTAYDDLFTNDRVLPLGGLREPKAGAGRADLVVVTKCPAKLTPAEKEGITNVIREYAGNKPVFFSSIAYGEAEQVLGAEKAIGSDTAVLTGIAKPAPFLSHVGELAAIKHHFNYKDHYAFTKGDLDRVEKMLNDLNIRTLVTTEKDMVRLLSFREHTLFKKVSLFYIPIIFEIDRAEALKEQVLKVVEKD